MGDFMNVKNRQKVLYGLFVLLLVIAIGMFVWYEFAGGRTTLNYERIVALKEEVTQGTTIEPSMLQTLNYEKNLVKSNHITNEKAIVGLVAKHYIPADTPLVNNYFDEADLVLKNDQYIAQLPKEWIISVPQTLRRGDRIVLYATDIKTAISIPTNIDENGQILQENQLNTVGGNTSIVELFETTVAFVKDSSNAEVVTTSKEDRKNANSSIASVEIVTTTDDFKKIEKEVNGEKRLILMYTNSEDEDVIEVTDEEEE